MKDKKPIPKRKQTAALDWDEVRHRLETAQASIEQGWTPTAEKQRGILKVRAKALAREPEAERPAEADLDVVEFLLAHEKYGIESAFVREVHPLKDLTPLPGAPPFVLGIINVRGRILSVIDIKKFFDLPEKGLSDLNKVIVLHSDKPAPSKVEGMEFGVLADGILGVRTIPVDELQPSLPTLTGIREEYLKGVTPERVVILDAEKLLSDPRMIVCQDAET
ncbi:MAG: purine-binding chemotaxis protein CheW [Nitrospirae bacterium]|nr:purine-binding chemotaxis protein CheW [Nitrospirota bacterium]